MQGGATQIDIPNSQSGRIHVGLSWEDIYDESSTSQDLTKGDIRKAKLSTFPTIRVLVIFLLFTLLGQAVTLQITYLLQSFLEGIAPSWVGVGITFAATTIIFGYMLYQAINQKGFFLLLNEKQHDGEQRDKEFQNFDMDLHCYVFDENRSPLYDIDPTNEHLVNPGEKTTIYHSGEDTDGAGAFGDETIHIETKKLDNETFLIFAVTNDCAHDFNKINNLKIRIVNSQTDDVIVTDKINSNEADGFVYCCIYKEQDKWMYTRLKKYIPFDDDWKNNINKIVKEI